MFVAHSVQEAVDLADRTAVIEVGLPHPRDVTSAEFGQLMRTVYAALREEGAEGG